MNAQPAVPWRHPAGSVGLLTATCFAHSFPMGFCDANAEIGTTAPAEAEQKKARGVEAGVADIAPR